MPVCSTFRTSLIAAMTACMVASGSDLLTNATPRVRISSVPSAPPSLSAVLAVSGNRDYLPRLRAVHALSKELSTEEVNALYALLNRKAGEDPMQPDQLNAVKNDVITALKKQTHPPVDLANNLAAMYCDPGHDVVWRDYCIQHLGDWYPSIADANDQRVAHDVIWTAAAARGGTIPGTALIALGNLAGRPGFDKDRISAKALAMASDGSSGEASRLTALQVCVRLGNRQVLLEARKIVDSTASVLVRVSAIACIGAFGDASDKPLLDRQAASTDRRLRIAAESALKKLGKGE